MKDEQVDLCGELVPQAEDEVFPVLAPDDTFEFACRGCGDCCRGREDIVLSGLDLFRIAVRLSLPPQVVVNAFCRQYIGKISRMPVVRLQPRKNAKHNCPFLFDSKCSIHEAKPLVCALYPLGQQIERDGTVQYFSQDTGCGGTVFKAKLRDYLNEFSIPAREPLDVDWAKTCMALAKKLKELEPELGAARLHLLQRRIYHALYLDYDITGDYAAQYAENKKRLNCTLGQLGR